MTVQQTAHHPATIAIPPGRYRLHPELTSVTFAAKKFGLFTIRGTVGLASGTFTVTTPLEHSTLHAVVAADTFSTPMAKRDAHVKGAKLLDTVGYPRIEFDSTDVVPTPAGWEVRGLLAVHGRVAPAVLTVTSASLEGGLVRIAAWAHVDRREFGVTGMRAAASSVIEVRMEAVGTPVGAPGR
jgi:polyisoprenoid-binding protein YceI